MLKAFSLQQEIERLLCEFLIGSSEWMAALLSLHRLPFTKAVSSWGGLSFKVRKTTKNQKNNKVSDPTGNSSRNTSRSGLSSGHHGGRIKELHDYTDRLFD